MMMHKLQQNSFSLHLRRAGTRKKTRTCNPNDTLCWVTDIRCDTLVTGDHSRAYKDGAKKQKE